MITIEYDDTKGIPVADGLSDHFCTDLIEQHKNNNSVNVVVSTTNVIDYMRLKIKKELIEPSEVCFKYKHYNLYSDKNGRLEKCPLGFCDYQFTVLSQL